MDDWAEMAAHQYWANGPRELSSDAELGPFVYYIQCGSFMKIGTSINPESRCDQLRRGGKAMRPSIWVGDPQLIAYEPGNVNKECALHKQFAEYRDLGEWFVLNDSLAEHVAEIQQQQCLMELQLHNARYENQVSSGIWPKVELNLSEMYLEHVTSKNQLDLEWIEALAA